MNALEFILNEHNNEITKDQLANKWCLVPPDLEEVCDWMKRFAELHILSGTKKIPDHYKT